MTTILGIFKPIRKISTHTSRVGCDYCRNYRNYPRSIISTHTSRVGCDKLVPGCPTGGQISTHTSRVGCDNLWDTLERRGLISTHTSRVGCDADVPFFWKHIVHISTHTSRVGCDLYRSRRSYHFLISTHTSRVGCDQEELQQKDRDLHFYSHIPCGMWPIQSNDGLIIKKFLLTHPVWDVTGFISAYTPSCLFLLTHPVWDVTTLCKNLTPTQIFLLTHPVWDVTQQSHDEP